MSDDDDVSPPFSATDADNNNTVLPPVVPAEVEYISLNAVDPTMGPYDSMVKATLLQLQIRTNRDDVEPLRVQAAPVRHVNGRLPAQKPPQLHVNYAAP